MLSDPQGLSVIRRCPRRLFENSENASQDVTGLQKCHFLAQLSSLSRLVHIEEKWYETRQVSDPPLYRIRKGAMPPASNPQAW